MKSKGWDISFRVWLVIFPRAEHLPLLCADWLMGPPEKAGYRL